MRVIARMTIIREFHCSDCNSYFESSAPVEEVECPNCAAPEAERVFLTPPSIKSPQTARKDEIQRDLAQAHDLSDMSNRYGQAVRRSPVAPEAQPQYTAPAQAMPILSRLGKNSDAFSPVLPILRQAGNPRTWAKSRIAK